MSDLISGSALIEELEKLRASNPHVDARSRNQHNSEITACIHRVNIAATVEAKPVVHGEWKRVGSGSLYDTYECTNCHRPPKWDCLGDNHWRIAFTDFCPHCGADMRKGGVNNV